MRLIDTSVYLFLALTIAIGCNTNNDRPDPNEGPHHATQLQIDVSALLAQESEIIKRAPKNASNALAFDLYKELRSAENVTYSPFSVSLALAMTYAGAKGNTEATMKERLHFGENTLDFHRSYGQFANLLSSKDRSQDETVLKISNVQWLQKDFTIFKEYTDTLANAYVAQPVLLDFHNNPGEATNTINETVSQQTNGEIPKLLQQNLVKDTRFVLTNAIYFNAKWLNEFQKYGTADGEFSAKDGVTTARYMKNVKHYRYGETNDLQALLVPYKDEEFAAAFILPKEGKLEAVEQSLSVQSFDTILDGLESKKVDFWLPKFSQRSAPNMKETLTKLGLGIIFDDVKSDFTRINGIASGMDKLYVHDVVHEAVVKMYEAGTTAAAATAVIGVRATAMPPVEEEPPVVFHATRPFLFFIIHIESKTILFMGRVDRPEAPPEQ